MHNHQRSLKSSSVNELMFLAIKINSLKHSLKTKELISSQHNKTEHCSLLINEHINDDVTVFTYIIFSFRTAIPFTLFSHVYHAHVYRATYTYKRAREYIRKCYGCRYIQSKQTFNFISQ